jgi:PD-(D/E)XK nuclease superfamily
MTQIVNTMKLEYPSKWDIIPIHGSDRGSFKFCRRQWGWSSPSRSNLTRRADVYGIYEPFWFGGGIHYALEHYYNPLLQEDPATTWLAWFDLQWEGGLVTEQEVKGFADRYPEKTVGKEVVYSTIPSGMGADYQVDVTLYKVKGLREILPFGDEGETVEHFMHLRDLGEGMMNFYKNYAETYDNFDVIATEHDFSVPLLNPSTGKPLYRIDRRPMPENWEPNFDRENAYGPLMYEDTLPDMGYDHDYNEKHMYKQVHARGRQDIIIREREHGRYGIRDYKTTGTVPDDDYFRHLELDEQCTTYLWAGEVEAKLHDLPYKKLEFIDYVAIFKGYPRPPTITSRGLPSIDRKNESTTARLFEQAVEVMGIKALVMADPKMQSYYNWLLEMGDKRFIWPKTEYRNRVQRENAGIRLYYEALDMLNPELKLYPNPTKNYGCLNCAFRQPCIAAETGADYASILEANYISNWDR